MTSSPLRLVLVDDEAIARRRLRRLLAAVDGTTVVGEAADGGTAHDLIRRTRPDLVLLDVQMPGQDGLALARRLARSPPFIVFVTAHDQYAIRAFDVHAVHYLLKPVSRARLAAAVEHVRERMSAPRDRHRPGLGALLDTLAARRAGRTHVPVRTRGRVSLLDVDRIDWIEAAGNYAVLHEGGREHLLRETLTRLEDELEPRGFVRVHRSSIVRLDAVERLETAGRGDYTVVLRAGDRVAMSRTHRTRLERALGRRL